MMCFAMMWASPNDVALRANELTNLPFYAILNPTTRKAGNNMFRKILLVLISLFLLLSLVGCDNIADSSTSSTTTPSATTVYTAAATTATTTTAATTAAATTTLSIADVKEGSHLSNEEIKALIATIPSDKYETYPNTHNAPVSATLYKNGEKISINVDDERLVKLINFFNYCVSYPKCSYIQSFLSIDYIEEYVTGCDFRLELEYTPYGNIPPSPYGTSTTMCDTIIVTNRFTLMAHDLPGYEGQSERYPFRAVEFWPLYDTYNWLALFGF